MSYLTSAPRVSNSNYIQFSDKKGLNNFFLRLLLLSLMKLAVILLDKTKDIIDNSGSNQVHVVNFLFFVLPLISDNPMACFISIFNQSDSILNTCITHESLDIGFSMIRPFDLNKILYVLELHQALIQKPYHK